MAFNLDKYNDGATQWKDDFVSTVKTVAAGMGVQHRSGSPSKSASLSKIKGRTRMKDGVVERISISFPRQLIYTTKGAGKGRGGDKGSRWIDKYGKQQKTKTESLGKAGTGGRKAKPFFNQTLDGPEGIDKLATLAAENIGSAITNNLFIQ